MLISIIVPCRNEKNHIQTFCETVFSQKLPHGAMFEVLIAEGQSNDGTREWLQKKTAEDGRFILIDNTAKIVSSGLNACLEQAKGEVIVRMDVHTTYASDYIAQCLAALDRTQADNVGGPWQAQATEDAAPMQRAVAAAFQSRWVTGGARSRQLDYEGQVDTVYLGCWPKKTFDRFGNFDENLVRNQDDEHNLRIVRGGGKIWQSAHIKSVYYPRGNLGQVFMQYLQYGYWKPFVMKKHRQPAALRHLAPGALVMAIGALGFLSIWGIDAARIGLALLLSCYVAFLLWAVVRIKADHRIDDESAATTQNKHQPLSAWRLAAVIATYHFSYGWGWLRGVRDVFFKKTAPAKKFGALTR